MPYPDLVAFALAAIIAAGGIGALIAHALRPPPKDRLLFWVGVFALLYGVRLLDSIRLVSRPLIGGSAADYVYSVISCVIIVPAIFFSEELYGRGWRSSMRWLGVAAVVYAAVAIAVDVALHDPSAAPDPALTLFAPGLAAVFTAGWLAGYRPPPFPEWRVLVGGFAIFILFVLNEHAVGNRLVRWNFRAEALGMLIFNGCLAYIGVSRFFATTRQRGAIDKEMEAARRIQASILPRELPSIRGVEIAARYVPLAAVAGDFYDVARIGPSRIAVLIADVSGHGVPAALIASMVKVAFAAEAGRAASPGAILEGMNATLCGMFDRAYVTAVCAIVDGGARAITYAAAGHPPPILVSPDGSVARLEERGMFLGMFPSAAYASAEVKVDTPVRLILYTDGVIEAADEAADDLFGIERLSDFAAEARDRPPAEFADALLARITAFARRDPLPHDDITVVVVDVRPTAG
jgi:sigma-B regulation protein RsbU (phosphoserine phosphatase)